MWPLEEKLKKGPSECAHVTLSHSCLVMCKDFLNAFKPIGILSYNIDLDTMGSKKLSIQWCHGNPRPTGRLGRDHRGSQTKELKNEWRQSFAMID